MRKTRPETVTLFLGTAAVVVWQSSRLTVLWDLSFILENATRIALGDVPYRDFPFPYAPLTFLVQSLIIRLFGRVAWHHVAYAALAAGLASVLAYEIVRTIEPRRITAFLLTLPLILLGIYCIFPHPFYDPDCCLAVLVVVLLLRRDAQLAAGVMAVVAVFVKQNIGLSLVIALIALAVLTKRWRIVAGVVAASVVSIAIVAIAFGIDNYVRWTVRFAAERRLMPIREYLSIYTDPTLWWWLGCVAIGVLLMRWSRLAAAIVISLPCFWIFTANALVDREVPFLRVWPLVLIVAAAIGVVALIRERDIVPLLIVGAIHGTFLSQLTWGSTYGIWPLLVILLAYCFPRLPRFAPVALVAALLFAGFTYVVENQRLTYVKLDGAPHRSQLPALRGMTVAGEWLPDLESLVAWLDRNVPRDDAILFLPGEDPLYFTTGRRPRFPVLMFDRTINPYDPPTIARLADERRVKWVIVKTRMQLNGTPMETLGETVHRVTANATEAARLHAYVIFRR